jgi:hypothetical protein
MAGALTPSVGVRRLVLDHARGRRARNAMAHRLAADPGPPAYVVELAAAAGLDVADHGWAMLAPGRYRTKKVVLLLFPPGAPAPTLVCKLTRDPACNPRLDAEWEALLHLRNAPAVRTPTPLLRGEAQGLAAVGIGFVEGRSLTSFDPRRDPRPYAATLEALGEFAVNFRGPRLAPTTTAVVLDSLLDGYEATYRPSAELLRRLREHVETISRSAAPFPTVLQHGDSGAWNVLVDRGERVTILDWESWDPSGVPLWDLLYLGRSAAVRGARAGGQRDRLAALDDQLREGSPVLRMVGRQVASVSEVLGLDPAVRLPLLQLCWVHRAMKEASRLPPHRLSRGHYHQLVEVAARRSLDRGTGELLGAAEHGGS